MIKLRYLNPNEREEIIRTQTENGFNLVREENIKDGNFLFFNEPSEIETLKQENEQLKGRLDELDAALFDVIIKTSMNI